jgi:hypothetical protein
VVGSTRKPSNEQAMGAFTRDPGVLNANATLVSAAANVSQWLGDKIALNPGASRTHDGSASAPPSEPFEHPAATSIRIGI